MNWGLGVSVLVVVLACMTSTRTTAQESGAATRSVWSGVYTEAQAQRGGGVYAQECANCHGGGLEGADMSPALTGAGFMANWNGLTVGDLFERIRISMPADRPGTITRQQNADVIAYMLQVNRFPAGTSELPTATPALKAVTIQSVKPADDGR